MPLGSDASLKDWGEECHVGIEDPAIFPVSFCHSRQKRHGKGGTQRGSNRKQSDTGHGIKNWGENRWEGGSQIYRVIKKGPEESLCEDENIN